MVVRAHAGSLPVLGLLGGTRWQCFVCEAGSDLYGALQPMVGRYVGWALRAVSVGALSRLALHSHLAR